MYGGGTSNLSSSFIAGFLWLDKLCLCSLYDILFVARQDFWGGNYGLIDNNYFANPDYWTSYLFKNLIGNRVIYVNNEYNYGRSIRIYAFCTKYKNVDNKFKQYNQGDLTIVFLNTNNNTHYKISILKIFLHPKGKN